MHVKACSIVIIATVSVVFCQPWTARILYPNPCGVFFVTPEGKIYLGNSVVVNSVRRIIEVLELEGNQWHTLSRPELGWPSDMQLMPDLNGGAIHADEQGNVYAAGWNGVLLRFSKRQQRWQHIQYHYPPNDTFEDSLAQARSFLYVGTDGRGTTWVLAKTHILEWYDSVSRGGKIKESFVELFRVEPDQLRLVKRLGKSDFLPAGVSHVTNFVRDGRGDLWCAVGNLKSILHIRQDDEVELIQLNKEQEYWGLNGKTLVQVSDSVFFGIASAPLGGGGYPVIVRIDLHNRISRIVRGFRTLYTSPNLGWTVSAFWTNGQRYSMLHGIDIYSFYVLRGTIELQDEIVDTLLHEPWLRGTGYSEWIDDKTFLISSNGLIEYRQQLLSVRENNSMNLTVYPHPVIKDQYEAYLIGSIHPSSQLRIIDALGRIVAEMALGMPPFVLPTEGLSAGTYTLVVQSPQGQVQTARFVVVD